MDKFGIFKLLNSFLGSATQNSSNPNPSSPDGLLNGLKDILNANGEKSNQPPPPEPPKPTPEKPLPLQTNMLSVMRSHDEFVNRVKRNNK